MIEAWFDYSRIIQSIDSGITVDSSPSTGVRFIDLECDGILRAYYILDIFPYGVSIGTLGATVLTLNTVLIQQSIIKLNASINDSVIVDSTAGGRRLSSSIFFQKLE